MSMLHNGIDKGSADVPVRIPSGVVPITRARAANETIVAISEPKGNGPEGDADLLPCYFIFKATPFSLMLCWGNCVAPPDPLSGYADRR